MKKWFIINYYKLAKLILPTMLRMPLLVAFVEACVRGVDYLYILFSTNRRNNNYHLSITPQVCYLEKALNDRFDYFDRRIYISDGKFYEKKYIYTRNEALPKYLYQRTENKPLYINTRREVGADNYDFIVNVPQGLRYDTNEMTVFIQQYKLASKIFTINEF